MALVREADFERDLTHRLLSLDEERAGTLHATADDVLVSGHARRSLEEHSEVGDADACHTSKALQRYVASEMGFDVLAHASQLLRRQSAARFGRRAIRPKKVNREAEPEALAKEQTTRKACSALRIERPPDVLDLMIANTAPRRQTNATGIEPELFCYEIEQRRGQAKNDALARVLLNAVLVCSHWQQVDGSSRRDEADRTSLAKTPDRLARMDLKDVLHVRAVAHRTSLRRPPLDLDSDARCSAWSTIELHDTEHTSPIAEILGARRVMPPNRARRSGSGPSGRVAPSRPRPRGRRPSGSGTADAIV